MPQEIVTLVLADVSRKAVSAAAHQPVHTLLALFQQDPELPLIAIADGGVFLGSVSRNDLLNLLSRKYAMDLYARKPVKVLLDDMWGERVVLRPELDINEAALRLLALDPALQTGAFPLVRNGHCVGVVAVSELMMAVATQQKGLLEELDRLNSQLREGEARGCPRCGSRLAATADASG
jgi:phosphoserine phosphatase RsbU/P